MINTLGNCLLRRFVGAPKQLFDCLVFNRQKKVLFEQYETSENEVVGVLLRQPPDTNVSRMNVCLTTSSTSTAPPRGKQFYCYEDPTFGLTVVRPAVRMGLEMVSDNIQLKLLPDYPNSGYPKYLLEKWLHDYASWKIYIFMLVMYVPLTLFLAYMLALVGNIIFVNQYYPLCETNIEFGSSCYPWISYAFSLAIVLAIGYGSAKKAFWRWKYQMLEKEISGYAARELLRQHKTASTTTTTTSTTTSGNMHRANLYESPGLTIEEEPDMLKGDDSNNKKISSTPLIARV